MGQFVGHRAIELLRAVDEGTAAGAPARELAMEVLRRAVPDSAAWTRAVAVLEGGPMKMRDAVTLAGEVLDAVGAEGNAGGDPGGASSGLAEPRPNLDRASTGPRGEPRGEPRHGCTNDDDGERRADDQRPQREEIS